MLLSTTFGCCKEGMKDYELFQDYLQGGRGDLRIGHNNNAPKYKAKLPNFRKMLNTNCQELYNALVNCQAMSEDFHGCPEQMGEYRECMKKKV